MKKKSNKILKYLRYFGYGLLVLGVLIPLILYIIFRFSNPELTGTQVFLEKWELIVIEFISMCLLYIWISIKEK